MLKSKPLFRHGYLARPVCPRLQVKERRRWSGGRIWQARGFGRLWLAARSTLREHKPQIQAALERLSAKQCAWDCGWLLIGPLCNDARLINPHRHPNSVDLSIGHVPAGSRVRRGRGEPASVDEGGRGSYPGHGIFVGDAPADLKVLAGLAGGGDRLQNVPSSGVPGLSGPSCLGTSPLAPPDQRCSRRGYRSSGVPRASRCGRGRRVGCRGHVDVRHPLAGARGHQLVEVPSRGPEPGAYAACLGFVGPPRSATTRSQADGLSLNAYPHVPPWPRPMTTPSHADARLTLASPSSVPPFSAPPPTCCLSSALLG